MSFSSLTSDTAKCFHEFLHLREPKGPLKDRKENYQLSIMDVSLVLNLSQRQLD